MGTYFVSSSWDFHQRLEPFTFEANDVLGSALRKAEIIWPDLRKAPDFDLIIYERPLSEPLWKYMIENQRVSIVYEEGQKRGKYINTVSQGMTAILESALQLIAVDKRPDGSWNRDREACAILAKEALSKFYSR
jgi:hypothetical protein